MFELKTEAEEDWWEVEALLDLTFGPGRLALSSYRLRDGIDPVGDLCLAARDPDGVLAGAIRFWPVRIGDSGTPALLLGPIAVHPTRQGEGLGALLIGTALERARMLGWRAVILVGDAPYYRRFGFSRDIARNLNFPPPTLPERVLGQHLSETVRPLAGQVLPWSV